MERSGTPWRILDAETTPTDPGPDPAGHAVCEGSQPWRTGPLVVALAMAAMIGVGAAALIASGPTPIAVVQTDTAAVAAGAALGDDAGSGIVPPAVADIVVHVAGAVRRPGIVTLPAGSRVADAIDAAGGLGPRVDAARLGTEVNLAAFISDGERVVVPSRDDPGVASGGASSGAASGGSQGGSSTGGGGGGPVDLNHATAEALVALPGIGEVTAAKIIAARAEQPFRSVDELLERKVVGTATLAKFRDLVVVR